MKLRLHILHTHVRCAAYTVTTLSSQTLTFCLYNRKEKKSINSIIKICVTYSSYFNTTQTPAQKHRTSKETVTKAVNLWYLSRYLILLTHFLLSLLSNTVTISIHYTINQVLNHYKYHHLHLLRNFNKKCVNQLKVCKISILPNFHLFWDIGVYQSWPYSHVKRSTTHK
jgi:hypothetical protein